MVSFNSYKRISLYTDEAIERPHRDVGAKGMSNNGRAKRRLSDCPTVYAKERRRVR